jgi:hypothetical protein
MEFLSAFIVDNEVISVDLQWLVVNFAVYDKGLRAYLTQAIPNLLSLYWSRSGRIIFSVI